MVLDRRPAYQQPPLPWVGGSEFSRIITATPTNKTPRFNVGDKVFGSTQGAFAQTALRKRIYSLSLRDGASVKLPRYTYGPNRIFSHADKSEDTAW